MKKEEIKKKFSQLLTQTHLGDRADLTFGIIHILNEAYEDQDQDQGPITWHKEKATESGDYIVRMRDSIGLETTTTAVLSCGAWEINLPEAYKSTMHVVAWIPLPEYEKS